MVNVFAKTPRYVLREGLHPTGPSVSQASSDVRASVIYGFSDKPEYDVFLSDSSLAFVLNGDQIKQQWPTVRAAVERTRECLAMLLGLSRKIPFDSWANLGGRNHNLEVS